MSQINLSERTSENKSQYENYPSLELHAEKVLIVVKTAPNPSAKYRETVCTAGLTESGKWIRLYPLSFRYIDFDRRFSKYQWISVEIEKRPSEKDFRIDSYQPKCETIKLIDKPLPAGDWNARKKIILPTIFKSMEEITSLYNKYKISLGIIKPKIILKFIIEEGDKTWKSSQQKILSQQVLFEHQPKELEKMPFKFSYQFLCDDLKCKGHTMQIIDWELYELYRHMKEKYSFSMDLILEKIKEQWFLKMCSNDRDTYLIVGSVYPKPSFVILGVFWPPKG